MREEDARSRVFLETVPLGPGGDAPPEDAGFAPSGGSASPDPLVSVVLPVFNGAETLGRALRALAASRFRDFELIVVDDGSTDESARVAERFRPHRLLRLSTNQGHTAARNHGVSVARGRVLFFTDADVCVEPDTLGRVAGWFEDPAMECLVGAYTPRQPHPGPATAYKNAWIHHTYARSSPEIDWFFTAVGAVRRAAFERVGGFTPHLRRKGGGGDVEFGRRLRAAGVPIHLDASLQVTHLRRFTTASLLANDYHRAAGWTRMMLESPGGLRTVAARGVANVSRAFAAGAVLSLATCVALPLALGGSVRATVAIGFLLAIQLWLDRRFLGFAAGQFGLRTAAAFAALGFLDRAVCGLGMAKGVLGWAASRITPTVAPGRAVDDAQGP